MSGLLDCLTELALVCGAGTEYATRNDFTSLCYKISQGFNIFVIDIQLFVSAETTNFFA
jgi:hypothetical protein